MGRWTGKYVIGLTGNIGMGKTLVRRMLEHLGAYTIDADALAHRVMEPGAPAYKPIVEMFGRFVVDTDGRINRERLGAVAFAHPDALNILEHITHPTIRSAIDTLITRAKHQVVVVEAIKLLEGELASQVDTVWVVDSQPEIQVQRLVSRRGLTEPDARKRITVQNPQADKLAKASVIITNNGTPEETWAQVQAAWNQMSNAPAAGATAAEPAETPPAQAPTSAPAASSSNAPTELKTEGSMLVKRPRPKDFGKIAELINAETGGSIDRSDIMAKFGEKTYLLAEDGEAPVGVIAFMVENLVTQVDEFVISSNAPTATVGKGMIEAMEQASDELQSEVAFVFLTQGAQAHHEIFTQAGYEAVNPREIRYPAWREAISSRASEDTILLYRRLRENLILKPI